SPDRPGDPQPHPARRIEAHPVPVPLLARHERVLARWIGPGWGRRERERGREREDRSAPADHGSSNSGSGSKTRARPQNEKRIPAFIPSSTRRVSVATSSRARPIAETRKESG